MAMTIVFLLGFFQNFAATNHLLLTFYNKLKFVTDHSIKITLIFFFDNCQIANIIIIPEPGCVKKKNSH